MNRSQAVEACPYQHDADERKSAELANSSEARIKRLAGGGVKVESFTLMRQILRGGGIRQAGFMAEEVGRAIQGSAPVLFQEGEAHQKQRAATARFFAPRVVTSRYREVMNELSERLMTKLENTGRGDLAAMSLEMAVAVAAEIVGLTNSSISGMSKRLDSFFTRGATRRPGAIERVRNFFRNQTGLVAFYWMDVKPAIRARRRNPKEDVISHLLQQGYTDAQILTECMTYGAAGMATTREFIVMAAWHLFERPALRAAFVATDEAGRIAILEEVLRLEPVVGALYRRTQEELHIEKDGRTVTIPAGTLLDLDIRAANSDPAAAGECPHRLKPDRAESMGKPIGTMSFGDGNHRCPGAAVALQESAIFLDRLLRIPSVRMAKAPTQEWNTLTVGYELRDAIVTVG
ncbi:MAG TPA: cytochrome P450 [Alphaproteobacteria bacterium]|nr:cytochrome P450 [Alphaproteobacteria bacterium]